MKSKATPGPWIIVGGCGRGIIVGPDKLPVVDWDGCASIKRSRSVCNANARLIAAAPELLEAAKEVYGYDAWAAAVDNKALADALGILRAAVAKATNG